MMALDAERILATLDGILEMQRTIRRGLGPCVETGLVFLRYYYEKLPEHVARRITEIPPLAVSAIPKASTPEGTEEERRCIAASVASDAAFAQVVRAANSYREKLGLGLLGADGNPKQKEVETDDSR